MRAGHIHASDDYRQASRRAYGCIGDRQGCAASGEFAVKGRDCVWGQGSAVFRRENHVRAIAAKFAVKLYLHIHIEVQQGGAYSRRYRNGHERNQRASTTHSG